MTQGALTFPAPGKGKTVVLELPGRWFSPDRKQSREESIRQLGELGGLFIRGSMAVCGLYLRICAHIRLYDLDPQEVNQALAKAGFPACRISAIKRVAYAPQAVFSEYTAGEYGFRVALAKSRLFHKAERVRPSARQRQLRRASCRVIRLATNLKSGSEPWEYELNGYVLSIRKMEGRA